MKKKLLRNECDAKVVKNMDLDQNGRVLQVFKILELTSQSAGMELAW